MFSTSGVRAAITRAATLVYVEGVGVGKLLHSNSDGITAGGAAACEPEVGAVGFGAYLGAAYVFEQDNSVARRVIFDNDVLELLWVTQAANDANGHLELLAGISGLLTELACSDFDVLFCECAGNIGSGGVHEWRGEGWDRARCAWRICARRR